MRDADPPEALADHVHPLTSVHPGTGLADLAPARELVAGAQVVGLGEASHGASEHFTLKHRLIELLVTEEGFTHIAIEASEAACEAIGAAVVDGGGDLAGALTGQGYTAWDTEEVAALLQWLRERNAERDRRDRVRFCGLDHGFNAHGRNLVRRYAARAAPELLPDVDDAFAGLDDLEARWPARLGDRGDDLDRAWHRIRALAAALRERGLPGPEQDRTLRALARMAAWTGPERDDRSRLMGENVLALLAREPTAKVVVWAHNTHIGVDRAGPGPSLGAVLREALGPRYVAIGLEFGEGTGNTRRLEPDGTWSDIVPVPVPPPPAGSLPWHLIRTRLPMLFLDLRRAAADPALREWLSQERDEHRLRWIEEPPLYEAGRVGIRFDGIAFVDRITPTHPTRNALARAARREGF